MNRRNFLKTGSALSLGSLVLPHAATTSALAQSPTLPLPPPGADGWISLLNGRDLTGWYSMLEKSGKGVAEAKKMVTMESEMLHIMGNQVTDEHFEAGYLATNQEFENVRIRVEYKWGVSQFYPRSLSKRDNGLLYGLVGEDKVWPRCAECQIEEGDVGDFFLLDGVRAIQVNHSAGLNGQNVSPITGWPKPNPNAPARPQTEEPTSGRKIKDGNFEMLDNWNVVEVIWQGDKALHIVNGRAVNAVTSLQQPDPANPGKFIPLSRGKIAIEIEYAETWFRRIEVKSLA
jgi:Domain of Unknown Function (DUF1080)